jgi:hypothetical protein
MSPEESPEVRIARLEVEVANLKDGHRDLVAEVKNLAERLNVFMVKTAVATAILTGGVNTLIDYYGGK